MTALTRSSPVVARPAPVAASPPWPHRKWIRGKREEERIDSIFIKKMLSRQLEIGREFELEWGGGEGERKAGVGRAHEEWSGRTLPADEHNCVRSSVSGMG